MFIYEISRKDRRERKGKLFANVTDTLMNLIHVILGGAKNNTDSLSKTVFSVKPLFKRFQRFEKPLYDMKDRSLKANWYNIKVERHRLKIDGTKPPTLHPQAHFL
ncbi:MAG: hypothetical protein BWK80_48385 [Desulfobacteraceae bacterium IS3]|nr:MAG: hypothetical protein BWK80_48385 [Desulfobacteraceae bacterium IS3]